LHRKDSNSNNHFSQKNNEVKPLVIQTMVMRMSEKQALTYLKDRGYNISVASFYRLKKDIQESTHDRLHLIASSEFLTQHVERLDTLITCLAEMWANYHKETNPLKRVQILEKIEENQLYLSSYYDSTRYVLEQGATVKQQEKQAENK